MSKNIHLYIANSDFQTDYWGEKYKEPWLSRTIESGKTKYNKSEYEKLLGTPLTFKIISAGTINWVTNNASYGKTIEYKKNNGEWTEITSNTGASAPSISVNAGDEVEFRGDVQAYAGQNNDYSTFSGSTAIFEIRGNAMSLIDSTDFVTVTTLTNANTNMFKYLFAYCTGLTSAEKLILPATTLAHSCYNWMFSNCTSLTTTPELPATILDQACYAYMFNNCTSLTSVPPTLPATTLPDDCYKQMFAYCTSLLSTPELPATVFGQNCCWAMFSGCTSLVTGPSSLGTSATVMATASCREMFAYCTSLTITPKLPATVVSNLAYHAMFYSCTTLTSAPELPATTLAYGCYQQMFDGCTGLTTAPAILPATTLQGMCYNHMFHECTNLVTAPELPAITTATWSYRGMFGNCTNLNYIKCLATNIISNSTSLWADGVSSSGTFIKNPDITEETWGRGVSGIPDGWTVQDAS